MQREIEAIEEARKALKTANDTKTSSDCDAALYACAYLLKILPKNSKNRQQALDSISEELTTFVNLPKFNASFKYYSKGYSLVDPSETLEVANQIFFAGLQKGLDEIAEMAKNAFGTAV